MSKRLNSLPGLTGAQEEASEPEALAWLSASAGTGKTQVLTARVFRLLLADVDPSSILCLTFTKAGAAEMADRIHERLAYWVRLKGPLLARELQSLGEPFGEDDLERARKLFARVLDAPGGGLRIQTIHAFSQSLLAAFPAEAGIVPGFRPLEGREEAQLARETLADMLVRAEEADDSGLIADVQTLSRRMGEDGAEGFLVRCGRSPDAMDALGAPELIEDVLRRSFDVPLGDVGEKLAEWCRDDIFPIEELRTFIAANASWGTKTGQKRVDTASEWLAMAPGARAMALDDLRKAWITLGGTFNQSGWAKLNEIDSNYTHCLGALDEALSDLLAKQILAEFCQFAAAGLRAGQHYATVYSRKKRRHGALDFNDLIRLTSKLLATEGLGQWVRYKLDQSLDHILVDEAQDTNSDQWRIVENLAEDFFENDPETVSGTLHRTIFAVGDFKQAIFGFQGTNPDEFAAAKGRFAKHIAERKRELLDLSLDKSYRSTPPILELVDTVMKNIGADAVGLKEDLRTHISHFQDKPGRVSLLRPVTDERGDSDAEEGWLSDAKLAMARTLAKQVKEWVGTRWLESKGRALQPQDILILVRSRSELASLVVARLHEEGVPVAGVDRLTLTEPLAIRDLLAALRFALQPDDDLNFANLLMSPLVGLEQDDLYALAKGRRSTLWSVFRDLYKENADIVKPVASILKQADLVTPYQLLESILSGPMQGRRKLLSRLGEEARDPIEELLNAALTFEQENPPSLQHFIDWFDRGTAEIKRDPAAPLDAVRVMTVHGAKGLQSPMVILADATFNWKDMPKGSLRLPLGDTSDLLPFPRPRKQEQMGKLLTAVEAQDLADLQEHWRLLYVAMTRAEEQLIVGGALNPRAKGEPPEDSWYSAIAQALEALGVDREENDLWGEARHFEGLRPVESTPYRKLRKRTEPDKPQLPMWLDARAPDEERPARPLAPSSLGLDTATSAPPTEQMRVAAERGKLLHRLFERLPDVSVDERAAAGRRWLERSAAGSDKLDLEEILSAALAVIDSSDYEEIFSHQALAEPPIAAVVDDVVVSGTVDRLLISGEVVEVIDFKTGHNIPANIDVVPVSYLKQMAAYAAALAVIFPDRKVKARLLYTEGPSIIDLPTDLLDAHKPHFADIQESLSPLG